MHRAHAFANRDYAVLVGFRNDAVVHRLGIFPRSFRFPFMGDRDLQIGDVWTDPAHRGRGLAAYGIQYAVERMQTDPSRTYWYVVGDDNLPSIRAAERAGLSRWGEATRTARLGLRSLGQFNVTPRRNE
jgi:RimJ/RimL family protein N-acetyltransferase